MELSPIFDKEVQGKSRGEDNGAIPIFEYESERKMELSPLFSKNVKGKWSFNFQTLITNCATSMFNEKVKGTWTYLQFVWRNSKENEAISDFQ